MQGVASGSWPALAGAPTIGTATAGALNASVAFTAPTYTGSGITGYTATSSPGGITGTGASSPITVSGLTAGTAYTFTVTATTAAGQSSPSAASNSVTPTAPQYIEDVFSTWLYTGNGSTQTITNGIDLSANGGLVWYKSRSSGTWNHGLFDTARGVNNQLFSNSTSAQGTYSGVTAFNTNGFSIGSDNGGNESGGTMASWTFRKQPKFFDVVTYTGTGVARTIAHNLGSVPGCMIVKGTTQASAGNWNVYHTSVGNGSRLILNDTTAAVSAATTWNNTDPTSTQFSVGTSSQINASGESYVAYLFAHNAGGFGLTGTDNVISCGSFTTAGSGKMSAAVNLGYEPQWLLVKNYGASENWVIYDNMRGMSNTGYSVLYPNLTSAEATGTSAIAPTATGFDTPKSSGPFADFSNYIYIAIRRGPMKVPTDATKVFLPYTSQSSSAGGQTVSTNFPVDLSINAAVPAGTNYGASWSDRLRGTNSSNAPEILSSSTAAENSQAPTYYIGIESNTSLLNHSYATLGPYVNWAFRRAPSFFDEVCYTGNSTSGATQTHNLGATPELMIVKGRSVNANWFAYSQTLGATKYLILNGTGGAGTLSSVWNDTAPTSTTFTLGNAGAVNASGGTYVAYLFATCAGVSKVGSYTGTGAVQTINCGFSGGARFVMVKRTNAASGWYVYDTARGMVTGTDNLLEWDSTAAQVNINSVTTASTGFQLTAENYVDINTNGGSYIFLAIA
jgi:hypothetical protein